MQKIHTTPRGLKTILPRIIKAGLVPLILSSPGIGKSSVTHQIGAEFNAAVIDIRLSTKEPQDLGGYPVYNERTDEAKFKNFTELFPLENAELPKGKEGWIIFLDEFTSVDEDMQAASYKLLLDREVGQEKLHPLAILVLAGNRVGDGAIANELGSAIYSRVVAIHVEANVEEWLEDVALVNKYDPRIIAYINNNPTKINTFDPEKSIGESFNCPRTLENLNKYLKAQGTRPLDDLDSFPICGIIGQGEGLAFTQFSKVFDDIIPFNTILKDPINTPVPSDPRIMWATIATIQDNLTEENFDVLVDYVNRLPLINKVLFFRAANARFPAISTKPKYSALALEMIKFLRS